MEIAVDEAKYGHCEAPVVPVASADLFAVRLSTPSSEEWV